MLDRQAETIRQSAFRLLGNEVMSIEALGGGRNSQVYKLTDAQARVYVLKAYFQQASDKRDRLQTEFSSLQFLWDRGLRNIPRPLAVDRNRDLALYEFIDGQKIPSKTITVAEIDAAVEFLTTLEGLKDHEVSGRLASEARFSVKGIVENIEQRLSAFCNRDRVDEPYPHLYRFLTNQLKPKLEEVVCWVKSKLVKTRMSFEQEIERSERTLSPSDFGLHNAIRRRNGDLVFLDFEYFGWDDPAKMIVDVLLHPSMNLADDLKQRFLSGILVNFNDYTRLAKRVEVVYPLFGLKWCLILLNEFLPQQLKRRKFAAIDDYDQVALQQEQLSKAERMLHSISEEYRSFPYFG